VLSLKWDSVPAIEHDQRERRLRSADVKSLVAGKCTFIPAKLFKRDHRGEVIRGVARWGIRLIRVVGSLFVAPA